MQALMAKGRIHTMRAGVLVALASIDITIASCVVRLTEAASRRPVYLVGTMHYNPHSVAMVSSTVQDVANRDGGLHATAIELCAARWNSTSAASWSQRRLVLPEALQLLSEDEFQVAFEASTDCGLQDVCLADQPIEETALRLRAAFSRAALDLLTPAGWGRVREDVSVAARQLPAFAAAALDARIVVGTPLALARLLYQSPAALPLVAVSGLALALAAAVDEATGALPAWEDGVAALLVALTLGRAVYSSLILERNVVLAQVHVA
jgi:hypothetical protein